MTGNGFSLGGHHLSASVLTAQGGVYAGKATALHRVMWCAGKESNLRANPSQGLAWTAQGRRMPAAHMRGALCSHRPGSKGGENPCQNSDPCFTERSQARCLARTDQTRLTERARQGFFVLLRIVAPAPPSRAPGHRGLYGSAATPTERRARGRAPCRSRPGGSSAG